LTLARALEAEAVARDSPGLRMLSLAFIYDLIEAPGGRRDTAGSPYASMFEDESGSYPPRPADVVPEARAVWLAVRDAIDDPIIVARISDLIFVADGRSAYADGRVGAASHLQLARELGWTALDRASVTARAVEVLAELNDLNGLADVTGDAVQIADDLLQQEYPGPPFIVLRALARLKPKHRPENLDALLDRTVERFDEYRSKGAALEIATDAAVDPVRMADLRRRRLDVAVDEAQASDGLVKVTLLQRAIEIARRYGFAQDATALLRELQELPTADLNLTSHTIEIEVPRAAVDRLLETYVTSGASDLFDALGNVGALPPPGGSNADIEAAVIQQEQDHPIVNLFPQQVFGQSSSAPQFIANTPESKRRAACGRQRALAANYAGSVLIGPMIQAASKHHGRPDHATLAEHFTTQICDAERADRVAHAVELFWDGDYDSSAHVLVPRLEAMLRDLARALGITIVTPAVEGRFSGFIPLGGLLRKLRELEVDVAWFDYLEALLCDPLAMNLRNNIAHGLVPRVGGVDAALLIHAACHLALVRLTES
jgi:hypothetical protein